MKGLRVNRKVMRKIIFLHMFLFLFAGIFNSVLKNPSVLSGITELLAWAEFLFCIAIKAFPSRMEKRGARAELWIVILILFVSAVSYLLNGYSLRFLLNGFRSVFKYFAFYFSCVTLLEYEDIQRFFEIAYRFIILNVIACTIEYFVLGYKGDFCSGLFGIEKVNSYINIFIVVMATYGAAGYIHKQFPLKKMIIIELCCMYISVLSELKFFFFEVAIIFVLNLVFYKPSKRTFSILAVGIAVIAILPILVGRFWSSSSSEYLSWQGLLIYIERSNTFGYSTFNDIGRINGISRINSFFFSDRPSYWGLGLGYCDYGSSFIGTYEYLHYMWFTYLLTYLELGWIGLMLYVCFMLAPAIKAFRLKKSVNTDFSKTVLAICFTLGFMCVVLLVYNSTLRNLPAYFAFFIMSFYSLVNRELERGATQ